MNGDWTIGITIHIEIVAWARQWIENNWKQKQRKQIRVNITIGLCTVQLILENLKLNALRSNESFDNEEWKLDSQVSASLSSTRANHLNWFSRSWDVRAEKVDWISWLLLILSRFSFWSGFQYFPNIFLWQQIEFTGGANMRHVTSSLTELWTRFLLERETTTSPT